MTTLFYQISKERLLYSHFCTFRPRVSFQESRRKSRSSVRAPTGLFRHVFVVFVPQSGGVAHPDAAGHLAESVHRVRAANLLLIYGITPRNGDVHAAFVLG